MILSSSIVTVWSHFFLNICFLTANVSPEVLSSPVDISPVGFFSYTYVYNFLVIICSIDNFRINCSKKFKFLILFKDYFSIFHWNNHLHRFLMISITLFSYIVPKIFIFSTSNFSLSSTLNLISILSSIIFSFTWAETDKFCSFIVILSILFKIFSLINWVMFTF